MLKEHLNVCNEDTNILNTLENYDSEDEKKYDNINYVVNSNVKGILHKIYYIRYKILLNYLKKYILNFRF